MNSMIRTCMLFLMGIGLTCMAQGEYCRTLKPDLEALRARHACRVGAIPRHAVEKRETQLDVVDILVAYDRSARNWRESQGKGSAEAFARARVEQMNECLQRSGLGGEFSFRLAGVVEFDIDASRGDLGLVLDSIIMGNGEVIATGEWAKIPTRREEVGADIVSILVSKGSSGLLGLGYSLEEQCFAEDPSLIPQFGDVAYNVSSIQTAESDLTMLHEIAHNMGCGHPDQMVATSQEYWGWSYAQEKLVSGGDLGPQLFSYSSGYYFWIDDVGYHTVMAYNYGGLRPDGSYVPEDRFQLAPYFSSPNCRYFGVPVGTAQHDNVRTLRQTYHYVAQYRASVSDVPDPRPDPEPVWQPFSYGKSRVFSAVANDATGMISGIVQLKVGKTNARKQTSKVSATFTGLDAKKSTSTSATVDLSKTGNVKLDFKRNGMALEIQLASDGFTGKLNGFSLTTIREIGLKDGSHFVLLGDMPANLDGIPICKNLLPVNEDFSVSRGKWAFGKAASVKCKKMRDASTKSVTYQLVVDQTKGKTNCSGLKLSCSAQTGVFRGGFKVYASDVGIVSAGVKPRFKKYSASVTGIVVNDHGYGRIVIKRPLVQTDLEVK